MKRFNISTEGTVLLAKFYPPVGSVYGLYELNKPSDHLPSGTMGNRFIYYMDDFRKHQTRAGNLCYHIHVYNPEKDCFVPFNTGAHNMGEFHQFLRELLKRNNLNQDTKTTTHPYYVKRKRDDWKNGGVPHRREVLVPHESVYKAEYGAFFSGKGLSAERNTVLYHDNSPCYY